MKRIILSLSLLMLLIFLSLPVSAQFLLNEAVDFSERFDEHDAIMLIVEVETRNIVTANKAALDFYGYALEEIKTKSMKEINIVPSEEIMEERVESITTGDSRRYLCSTRLADGQVKEVEMYFHPFEEGGRSLFHIIIFDVTDRVLMEQELEKRNNLFFLILALLIFLQMLFIRRLWVNIKRNKESKKEIEELYFEYEKIFNGTHDAMFLVGINKDNEFRYMRTNKAHQQKTGIKGSEIKNKTPQELLGAKVGNIVADNYKKAVKLGKPITYEEYLALPAGEKTWITTLAPILKDNKISYIVGSAKDITDQKKIEKELRISEERFRKYVENASDILIAINRKGKIKYLSPNIKNITGYEAGEIKGKPFDKFINADKKKSIVRYITTAFLSKQLQGEIEFPAKHKNGELRWYAMTGTVTMEMENEPMFIGIIRDINERKMYEQHLEYLSVHDKLTGLYNRAFFEAEIRRFQISREFPVTIISCDIDGLKIVNDTMGHDKGDKLLKKCARLLKKGLRGSDIVARVGGDEFAVILPKTDSAVGEIIAARIKNIISEYNNNSKKSLPLSVSIGAATATSGDVSLLETLKEADEKMYHEKLIHKKSSRSQIIDSLMAMLAEKDYLTEGHSKRIAEYSIKIGGRLNLSSDKITNLKLLAQVHDLGKVGISDNILFKRGGLTEEEWKIMRKHPEKGYRIAINTPDLASIADLILRHHEKWNGTGYPLAIKGEEIPIESRILAVVDAYDAMINDRPYRKKMTRKQAIKELKAEAGKQFDPKIVDIFLDILEEEVSDTDNK